MDTEYRGVIQPIPSLPEPEQRAMLKPFNPTEVYVLGRDECGHDDLLKQQRKRRVLVTPWVALLARQKGKKDARYASLVEFVGDLHRRGGYVLEAATGLRSDKQAGWRIMREKAAEMLGRIAQGSHSAVNGRKGAIGFAHTDQDIMHMLRIMDSKRYRNDKSRINAIKAIGVLPVPKRTWLNTRLKLIARERGLL